MSSLFGELDVASAEDDPFAIPDNTYDCFLTDVKVGPTKDKSKTGMTLVFTISEGEHANKKIQEWKRIPTPADPKNLDDEDKRSLSFLKARLLDLGVPAERVNTVSPDDLIGKRVYVSVKNNNGYTNVKKVVLADDSASDDPFA